MQRLGRSTHERRRFEQRGCATSGSQEQLAGTHAWMCNAVGPLAIVAAGLPADGLSSRSSRPTGRTAAFPCLIRPARAISRSERRKNTRCYAGTTIPADKPAGDGRELPPRVKAEIRTARTRAADVRRALLAPRQCSMERAGITDELPMLSDQAGVTGCVTPVHGERLSNRTFQCHSASQSGATPHRGRARRR